MGTVATVKGASIIIRSRDHCDPHVHAIHEGEGWEIKIFFSYVDTAVRPAEEAERGAPKNKQVQACMDVVTEKLDECRSLYWDGVKSTCLENKHVRLIGGEIWGATATQPGAMRVQSAQYIANNSTVVFVAGNIQYVGNCP